MDVRKEIHAVNKSLDLRIDVVNKSLDLRIDAVNTSVGYQLQVTEKRMDVLNATIEQNNLNDRIVDKVITILNNNNAWRFHSQDKVRRQIIQHSIHNVKY